MNKTSKTKSQTEEFSVKVKKVGDGIISKKRLQYAMLIVAEDARIMTEKVRNLETHLADAKFLGNVGKIKVIQYQLSRETADLRYAFNMLKLVRAGLLPVSYFSYVKQEYVSLAEMEVTL